MSTHANGPEPEAGTEPPAPPPHSAETTTPAGTEQEQPRPADAQDEHAAALDELQDRWRRALADIDNLRKRHARELERERAEERARTAAALLPIVDNLELALAHAGSDPQAIVDGVKAVYDQAVDTLRRLGFERHAETGVPFDPTRHEVVGVAEDPDAEPGTVVQVMRPGYGDGERQLRPAAVTVGKRQE